MTDPQLTEMLVGEGKMTERTEGEWSSCTIHRMTTGPGAFLQVHLDEPPTHWSVRSTYKDHLGRRCTVQIAKVYFTVGREPEAELNARLIAASPTMYDYIIKRAAEGDADAARIIANI